MLAAIATCVADLVRILGFLVARLRLRDCTRRSVRERLDALTERIIGSAIDVHRTLGPGMLESAYDTCLAFELVEGGLKVVRQKPVPLVYGPSTLGVGYRLDLLVEDLIIVEVKAVERLEAVHGAQLLSYLKLSRLQVGLLFNFNVKCLTRGGLKRIMNGFPDSAKRQGGQER